VGDGVGRYCDFKERNESQGGEDDKEVPGKERVVLYLGWLFYAMFTATYESMDLMRCLCVIILLGLS
jgi:hypothetical protein